MMRTAAATSAAAAHHYFPPPHFLLMGQVKSGCWDLAVNGDAHIADKLERCGCRYYLCLLFVSFSLAVEVEGDWNIDS